MYKKVLITAAILATALATQVNAEYNKYNEMDVINITNATLYELAEANGKTVSEFKEAMGLPEDMPDDTNEAIASGSIAIGKLIELSGESVDEALSQIKEIYAGEEELTAQTPFREIENSMTIANYFGASGDVAEMLSFFGLSEVIKPEDMLGDVRTIFDRKLLQMSGHLSYFEDDSILVMLKGKYIDFDVAPVIINDRVMVPMRNIFEALGAKISWMGDTQTIFAVKGSDIITMQVGQDFFFKNEDVIEIDSPSVIVDGRTLVPIRAVSEALDTEVFYNENTKTVVIH